MVVAIIAAQPPRPLVDRSQPRRLVDLAAAGSSAAEAAGLTNDRFIAAPGADHGIAQMR